MRKRKKNASTARVPELGDTSRRWWKAAKGEKRYKLKFSPKKKYSDDVAYAKVLKHLTDMYSTKENYVSLYAETISASTNIRINEVHKALMRLNREGICSTRVIWDSSSQLGTMHTRLDWYGDDPVQWEAKKFYLYTDKLREHLCSVQKK